MLAGGKVNAERVFLVSAFCIAVGTLYSVAPEFKYFFYIGSLIAPIALLSTGLARNNVNTFLPLLVFSLMYIIWVGMSSPEGMKEGAITLLVLISLSFYPKRIWCHSNIDIAFKIFVLINVVWLACVDWAGRIDFSDSRYPSEHAMFAPIFMFFAIYYFRHNKIFFIISTVLCFLAFKRIVLVALLLGLIIKLVRPPLSRSTFPLAVFVLLGIVISVYMRIPEVIYDDYSDDYLNYLTQGRYYFISQLLYEMKSIAGTLDYLFGFGPGFTSTFMKESHTLPTVLTNIHSDILKVVLEFGLVGFVIFFTSFIAMLKQPNSYCLLLPFCLALVTDNFLIYLPVMYVLFILLAAEELECD